MRKEGTEVNNYWRLLLLTSSLTVGSKWAIAHWQILWASRLQKRENAERRSHRTPSKYLTRVSKGTRTLQVSAASPKHDIGLTIFQQVPTSRHWHRLSDMSGRLFEYGFAISDKHSRTPSEWCRKECQIRKTFCICEHSPYDDLLIFNIFSWLLFLFVSNHNSNIQWNRFLKYFKSTQKSQMIPGSKIGLSSSKLAVYLIVYTFWLIFTSLDIFLITLLVPLNSSLINKADKIERRGFPELTWFLQTFVILRLT